MAEKEHDPFWERYYADPNANPYNDDFVVGDRVWWTDDEDIVHRGTIADEYRPAVGVQGDDAEYR